MRVDLRPLTFWLLAPLFDSNKIVLFLPRPIESIIENKLDFIKIKDRQIDLISNEFVFGNILFRESSQVLNTVLINIGSNDFSYQDSKNKKFIVIDVNGNLVGRITSLGNNSSIVQ